MPKSVHSFVHDRREMHTRTGLREDRGLQIGLKQGIGEICLIDMLPLCTDLRFNGKGLEALRDAPRSGRPATYTAEQVSEVIATALTKPKDLGLPFACWTLDRLEAYLNEVKGIPIKRSRINEILIDEGLRWRKQETWFGERVAPEFAGKRGPSRSCTPNRRMVV